MSTFLVKKLKMNNFRIILVFWATKSIYVSSPKNCHIVKFVVQKWMFPKKRRLCDCNGSYCQYCWLGVFSCTFPYVWYKITKALNMGNMVKAVLAVTILVVVFQVLNAPIQYNTPRVPTIQYRCRF